MFAIQLDGLELMPTRFFGPRGEFERGPFRSRLVERRRSGGDDGRVGFQLSLRVRERGDLSSLSKIKIEHEDRTLRFSV